MLRASSRHTGRPADARAVVDLTKDALVPHGAELLAFTDAAVLRDRDEMPVARQALLDVAGPEAVVRAAGCAANFQMMNRLLDALGVEVRRQGMELAAELGLAVPDHLRPAD